MTGSGDLASDLAAAPPGEGADRTRPSVAVVGAGLAGLVAALRLQQDGFAVRVFEAEDHPGGRVETVEHDGYRADTGATVVVTYYHRYLELAAELGLRVHPAPPIFGVAAGGRIQLMRTDRPLRSGLTTNLISLRSKVRVARVVYDIARARRAGQIDSLAFHRAAAIDTETARDYARRVVGEDFDRQLVDPVTRVMQIANSDKVGKATLFSALANIINSRFGSLEGGQARMVDALTRRVEVELNSPVGTVREHENRVLVEYTGPAGDARVEQFDAAVVTCPAPAAARMCPDHADALQPLARIGCVPTIGVAVGTTRPPACPATFVLVPSAQDATIAYLFIDSNKAPDRAPAGHGLIGFAWEEAAARDWFDRDDQQIVDKTLETAFRLFPELRGTVDFTHVRRWSGALPFLPPGAAQAQATLRDRLGTDARLQFAGDFLNEPGQNSAIANGTRAASNLRRVLAERATTWTR